jgi:hypothetical protein
MGKCRFFIAPLILVAVVGFGFITMYLWNWLMPYLFHLPLISFWQAAGLLILSRLLFGFGCGHMHGGHHRRGQQLREKWENMSPEEREAFMAQHRHGPFGRFHNEKCCSKKDTEGSESK